MQALLLMITFARLVGSEFFIENVDAPIPTLDVVAVSEHSAKLPCDLTPKKGNEMAFMVFWYKNENGGEPIYSVDARTTLISDGKLWSKKNVLGDRAKMRTSSNPAILEINPVLPEDEGLYTCRVDFRDTPTKNQKINFTVIIPPETPLIYTSTGNLANILQPFNEDSPLSMVCKVTGGKPPPKVVWYLENKILDESYTSEMGDTTVNRLDISKVTRDFLRARLICKAHNSHLVKPAVSEIILKVNLKPLMVNITNKVPQLSALRTYEIECTSSGSRPKATITWWKGNNHVKHMARNFADNVNVSRSVLSYVPTIEDNGKFLTCRAENNVIPESALEDKWLLVVHYVPVVRIRLGKSLLASNINEGDDVYFECEVKANPKAYKLAWYKDGKELHQNITAGIILPGGQSLVLQSVSKSSAGEYSCMAANIEGKATSRPVSLEVMYAPMCKDGSSTQVVGALKHETISLVCGVQSKPAPITFHWTFNNSGELMNVPPTRYTQVKSLRLITNNWHGSRLNYTPANDMDYGTVACWARNRIGVQKTPCLFQIIVAGKPYPLQNCSAQQSTGPYAYRMGHEDFKTTDPKDVDWLIVRCNEGFDGGLPLTSFELEVFGEDNDDHMNTIYLNRTTGSTSGPIFEIAGLEPGRNYRLLIYAVNAKGRSDPVILEPVTLKGVAMYTTGRGASEDASDYSLLVACFAGGLTAVCILVVGVTLTLYRRNHFMQPMKTQTHIVHYEPSEDQDHDSVSPVQKAPQRREQKESLNFIEPKDLKEQVSSDPPDEDPDVIPSKVERRPDIFEPNYTPKPERIKDPGNSEIFDYSSRTTVLQGKDGWIYPNGYRERPEELSPVRPNTLPVHRSHDIYTRSLRVQESCI
ncbi:hemicentin-1-like isoform X2 [Belonocnema kinseyi]|uniref:hemicentin-1-like isoform X2 n=1 Tax=Belonocnema kinseyi TaxID=2817044 RepID=UPI00143CD511|nr:hemicentin-1-like isoform X2 [Belonocnema kinseyi]